MSMRQELRENRDAMELELSLLDEALFVGGARIDTNVRAVFHHLKTKVGLIYWPTALQISQAIKDLQRGSAGPNGAKRGEVAGLSFDERAILEDRIIPTARRWLDIPGLRDQGEMTLAYWGIK